MNKNLRRRKNISYKNVGDRFCLVNNNCHLCKSIITFDNYFTCKNTNIFQSINNKTSEKNKFKNHCNKIFCMNCYKKYFPEYLINS